MRPHRAAHDCPKQMERAHGAVVVIRQAPEPRGVELGVHGVGSERVTAKGERARWDESRCEHQLARAPCHKPPNHRRERHEEVEDSERRSDRQHVEVGWEVVPCGGDGG